MVSTKKRKKRAHVPFRLNILFFAVFVLFSLLILRLGIVQIVYGDDFKREVERTEDVTVKNPVPRGKMFDRNGQVILDNEPLNAITYTRYQGTTQEEMLEVAEKLAGMIEKPYDKLQERDKKDFWLLKNEEEAKKLITKKEWDAYYNKEITDKKLYDMQVERVTEKHIKTLTPAELEVAAIWREFNAGYAQTPQIVKNVDVSDKEFAVVSENLEDLPGVDTTTDWKRKYVFGDTLRTILGNTTSSAKGIPREQLDYYLSRDYSLNDRVGISYIEKQYEEVLQGQKAKVKNKTDKGGNVLGTEVVSEGQRGKDLVLTIDMELQREVEKILEEELWAAKRKPGSALLDRGFVVMMDPHTGDILTMAGKKIEKDPKTGKYKMDDYAYGTFTSSYNVGSTVKGATVYTGLHEGVITPSTTFYDTPMNIKGTPKKSSWKSGIGSVNAASALEISSNVYMFHVAIKLGKGTYIPNQPLPLDLKAFNTFRENFSQFGLGVRTGLDLPSESAGFAGPIEGGKLLDLAIGQYDTYTAMQLAQYVSTVANGGTRIQPHIVKEIREPEMESDELGPIIQEIQPKVLNRIDKGEEYLDVVKQGFWRVMHGSRGTARSMFNDAPYNPAGKTGTAEAFYDGFERKKFGKIPPEVMNLSLIAFAPYEKPEIAISVLIPWAYQGSGDSYNNIIGRKALDAYFEIKKKRASGESNSANDQEQTQNGTENQTE
ncbi:penicillin-binding protein [Bacillus sp. FJAT-18017]|uniref:peptidoglycan D,D-transpeptidase FtsI family protein n=1 Tax=Bacillus sp. FJAT-18017 TaxID=1705566 RepID=UPI0006AE6D6F|nr:penicillin-binding protein 2 [Bacillus sp. FJAT-18017]ALC89928.1 penicillin-binding protein [Bacillus sp. FJAT-18017]